MMYTLVLGLVDGSGVEILELKGPPEQLLNTDKRHRGFSSKVHRAVDQVRDRVSRSETLSR